MIERRGVVDFKGQDVSVVGMDLKVGEGAQEFTVTDFNWNQVPALESTKGKVRIIASVPSLDTTVCDIETRRFNQEAASLSNDIVIIVVSVDLPFAQKRWCGAAGVDQVMVVSDHKSTEFGQKYSTLLQEPRILRRAVFIVDKKDTIRYVDYMPSLGVQPDYAEVLDVAERVLVEGS